jgi:hypothetical protein
MRWEFGDLLAVTRVFRICVRTIVRSRNVSHLRCSELGLPGFPALPGWAKLWRASGAWTLSLEPRAAALSRSICVCRLQFATQAGRLVIRRSRFVSQISAPEARKILAQPGRAGYAARSNFEHRRCGRCLCPLNPRPTNVLRFSHRCPPEGGRYTVTGINRRCL